MEGVSHGLVLENLKTGFHQRRIPWTLDITVRPGAPHGEDNRTIAAATAVASCITYDFAELHTRPPKAEQASAWVLKHVPVNIARITRARIRGLETHFSPKDVTTAIAACWPFVVAMKRIDDRIRQTREKLFKAAEGREFARAVKMAGATDLQAACKIAVMVALADAAEVRTTLVDVTPVELQSGPHPDNARLRLQVGKWVSLLGDLDAKARLEIGPLVAKESIQAIQMGSRGRCEVRVDSDPLVAMGNALMRSTARPEKELWRDWYRHGVESALEQSFGGPVAVRAAARESISESLRRAYYVADVFGTRLKARDAVNALAPDAAQPLWMKFSHGFLTGSGGAPVKRASHARFIDVESVRARFHKLSEPTSLEFRLRLARRLLGIAGEMRMAQPRHIRVAEAAIERFNSSNEFIADISRR